MPIKKHIIIDNQIKLINQTIELLLIVIEFEDFEQTNRVASQLLEIIKKSEYFKYTESMWYYYKDGNIKYKATIPTIIKLPRCTKQQLIDNKQIFSKNLIRLKNFFIIIGK